MIQLAVELFLIAACSDEKKAAPWSLIVFIVIFSGFRNLTALYIGSFLWEASLWLQFVNTIKSMPRLETLVVKDPLISVTLRLENKTLKNFGLYARGLKKMDIFCPQLESLTVVHTLSCGTGFFADLM